jgi:hypothetical protein
MSQKGLFGLTIHSSPVKAVLEAISKRAATLFFVTPYEWAHVKGVPGAIFDSAASQFSLTVYESTGAVVLDESIRHM